MALFQVCKPQFVLFAHFLTKKNLAALKKCFGFYLGNIANLEYCLYNTTKKQKKVEIGSVFYRSTELN